MRAEKLLHSLLDKACIKIDKRLRKTLFSASATLIFCKRLSIAGLGRSLPRLAKVKHKIKCIDRLFGNEQLHQKRKCIYAGLVHFLVSSNKTPVIIVDWSGLTPCGAYYFLSASLSMEGRSITLYEECYPLKDYLGQKTHREFLKTLKVILPRDCIPIIITDAGFRNTWFTMVIKMGWDFIGRVRNGTQYAVPEVKKKKWTPIKELYDQATLKARYIGCFLLAKNNPLLCYFYLMRQKKRNRIKKNLIGNKVQCSSSKKHAKGAKEPWLIVSSLAPGNWSALKIMMLYKKRMQIEETFRDLKNMRNGFGLRHCRSFSVNRLNVALIIATLAMLVLWLFGITARQKDLHYTFQSNTEKRRNVLSTFVIGCQVLIQGEIQFKIKELLDALEFIISVAGQGEKC